MTPAFDQAADTVDGNRSLPFPADFHCVAVICSATAPGENRWPTVKSGNLATLLSSDVQVIFDYYPVRYAGPNAGADIDQAFERIARQGAAGYDAVLIIGEHGMEADIGVIHRVLAPRIAAATVPVLTALGADDNETILGDTACRTFSNADLLLETIAGKVSAQRPPAEQLFARIRSLGHFLLAQHEVESKILMQAAVQPMLLKHLQVHQVAAQDAGVDARHIAQLLQIRLLREEATLEQFRARIGVEAARMAQRVQATPASPPRVVSPEPDAPQEIQDAVASVDRFRAWLLFGYLCLIASMWWWTTPANTIFFGGCALVGFSAVYVAISNRIMDRTRERTVDATTDANVEASPVRIPPASGSADASAPGRKEPWLDNEGKIHE